MAAAADLREDIYAADFTGSIRSGTIALRAAMDAVNSGSAHRVLVVAADCRIPAPGSEHEAVFGDGSAALLVGDSDIAISIEDSNSISSEFMDIWKTSKDRYLRTWEDRFILTHGYEEKMVNAVSGLLKKHNLKPNAFSKAVFYGPDTRSHTNMIKTLGLDPKQVQEPLFNSVGNTGAAFTLMTLVSALEAAKAGDKILMANYGDGADVFILQVTNELAKLAPRRGIKNLLPSKLIMPNYEKYLSLHHLVEGEAERRPPLRSSLTVIWRERNQIFRFHGGKCKRCGTIQMPIQRVCGNCRSKDNYEEVRLSDVKGKVFTFSKDERALSIDLPLVLTIVDFDGGGRFFCIMTDREHTKIEIGMPVEMTFRNIHDGAGFHNYYWKTRPRRC